LNTLTSPLIELIDGLLAQSDHEARAAFLRQRGRYDAETLKTLAAAGDALVRDDPGRGAQLAEILIELAERLPTPLAAAQARYLRAQAYALAGDFAQALPLIAAARQGFLSAGCLSEAIRTYVGEMHALAGLGRYSEALAAGEQALTETTEPFIAALVAQNQGLICHRMGRYEDALAAYDKAAAGYAALDQTERLGHVHNNRGVVLLSLGRGHEAVQAFQEAASIFAAKGLTLLTAQAQANRGAALSLMGDHRAALEAFETARRAFETLGPGVERGTLDLDTATAYLALNLYPEALAACDEALAGFRAATMPYEQGQALVRRAAALAGLGQPAAAEAALAEAETIFRELGNEPWLAIVRLEQAGLWESLGRGDEALAAARDTLALCERLGLAVQSTYAHLRLADLLADQAPETALAHLEKALAQAEALALPQLRYRAHARLGRLLRLQGRTDEALEHLTQAIEEIEHLRATLPQETLRTAFLRDKLAPYEDLIQLYLARGDEEGLRQAFAVAERARSRALLDLLAGSIDAQLRATEADEAAVALRQRLWALRADLDLIYNELLAADTGVEKDDQRGFRLARLRSQAHQHEQEITRLRLRLEAVGLGYLDVARPLPLEAVQATLSPRARLLAYYIVGDELLAFIINPRPGVRQGDKETRRQGDGSSPCLPLSPSPCLRTGKEPEVKVHRRLATPSELALALDRLGMQWNRFRLGNEHVARHRATLERSTRAALADLYDRLVRPLADDLDGDQLIIVPHGPLHGVPFHALYDGQGYLIERYEISYAPSATVMARCQARPRRSLERALVVAVPGDGIPYVAQEAEAVAALFPKARLLQGQEATMSALRAAAPGRDLLHLACHGLFRADNPLFSALRLGDGWLTVAEAAELGLEAGLVTLSACESGRSRVVEGDELLGLARAFLGSGAASLVVSLWLVNDASTARLMEEFYRGLRAGQSGAAALRAAQRALLAADPHPYYWAPFMLVGQR
jgi:tetratricopeptide (TPR) repeat protein